MNKFYDLGLSKEVVEAITEMGFKEPTEIQELSIPILLKEPTDFIGLAQTGTGKTAAFGLPLIELINSDNRNVQSLILAPTRELAQQIHRQLELFSQSIKKINIACVFGGASIETQIRELRSNPQVVVATPGRLMDLMRRKKIDLSALEYLVLDEADEMLNMGFKEDIDYILQYTPEQRLIWLFSATMPPAIRGIVKSYMDSPKEAMVDRKALVNTNIQHQYAPLRQGDKLEALSRIIDSEEDLYGICFCRTKRDCQAVSEKLSSKGYAVEAIHGDLTQAQRDRVMTRFRSGNLKMLVATDVAARGIDVEDITHVFHYHLPDDQEYYTHRSGRTARAGKKGVSIAFVSNAERRKLDMLQRTLKIRFEKIEIPSAKDIRKKRLNSYAEIILAQDASQVDYELLNEFNAKLEALDRDDLLSRIFNMKLNELKLSEKDLSSMNTREFESRGNDRGGNRRDRRDRDGGNRRDRRDGGRDRDRGGRDRDRGGRDEYSSRNNGGTEEGMQKYFISLGKADGMQKGTLLKVICDHYEIPGRKIGRISLLQKHSYVDIDQQYKSKIIKKGELQVDGSTVKFKAE